MTDPTQAATLAWYAVKNDTRSPSPTADPTPYIAAIVRAILAAKDAEIAGLREVVAQHVADLRQSAVVLDEFPQMAATADEMRKAADELDAALTRGEGVGE